jgi:hypothetical protein
VIVFYHIPKTAGVSILRAAADAIDGVHQRVFLPQLRAWLRDLDRGLCDTDRTVFLSGHFGYGVHQRLPGESSAVTFLRHPVDQTISMHYEARKRPDIYPHGDLRLLLSSTEGEPYFGNAQVRHLASRDGRPVRGVVAETHLALAKDVIANELSCFGLTEYFSSSIAMLNARLGIDLTVREENVSSRALARDLDPELLSAIWDANALDRELYEYARALFFERLRHVAPAPAMKAMLEVH